MIFTPLNQSNPFHDLNHLTTVTTMGNIRNLMKFRVLRNERFFLKFYFHYLFQNYLWIMTCQNFLKGLTLPYPATSVLRLRQKRFSISFQSIMLDHNLTSSGGINWVIFLNNKSALLHPNVVVFIRSPCPSAAIPKIKGHCGFHKTILTLTVDLTVIFLLEQHEERTRK